MSDAADAPRILTDPGTQRPILMSPGRLSRPRNTGETDDGVTDCPFCEGHEHLTTPEADAIRATGTEPGTPGWRARAFPNLYPAWEHHEVIAEGARHTAHPAELDDEELLATMQLYRRRLNAFEERDGVVCAFLFKNVGALAGSSIEHNHSQLLGLPMIPPRLVDELHATAGGCIHCAEIADAEAEDRIIVKTEHHVLLSPRTPKLPFETWLLPLDHALGFDDARHDASFVTALGNAYRGMDAGFDGCPFNSYLHRIKGEDFHWHFEFQPRVGMVAALELGGDMYINAVTPQESARRWRAN